MIANKREIGNLHTLNSPTLYLIMGAPVPGVYELNSYPHYGAQHEEWFALMVHT